MKKQRNWTWIIIGVEFMLLAAVALSLLCGCSTTKYIPYETVRDQYHAVYSADTIAVRDSIIINRSGDTIRELRWRDRWRLRTLHDTILVSDTICRPYPVEVPAKLTAWQRIKVDCGGWAILLCLGLIVVFIYRHN